MEVFSLPEAVREAVEAVRREVEVKSQQFHCSIDQAAAAVRGSESSFREAVANLLFNAVKYTPEGGTITIETQTQAGAVVIEISDTGIGIPHDEQARVFEEFYRASNARRVEHDGDGLGLSLVKRVVELHGGTISFSSELGRGTTFRILLPLVSSEAVPDSAQEQLLSHDQRNGVQTVIS
jgi:signal transduction histidine kinase